MRLGIADEDSTPVMRGIARSHEAYAIPRVEVVRALAVRVILPRLHEDTQATRNARVETLLVRV